VLNVTLRVSAINETITVEACVAVETTGGELTGLIKVLGLELPLNGGLRN
jgi:hypothetical protein